MRKVLIVGLICLIPFLSYAGMVERYSTYSTGGSVTATNLNGNLDAPINEMNGGLDNDNADTSNGYRFYEVKASNPSAGTEGRLIYNTAVDHLYTDDGTSFNSIYTGIPTLGCDLGTTITEFSTDGTLSGNSDNAVPTEKAAKTYTDTQVATKIADPGTVTDNAVVTWNGTSGTAVSDNSGVTIESDALSIVGGNVTALSVTAATAADTAAKIIKTDATTEATLLQLEHQEHGSNVTLEFKAQTDAGASKSITVVCDPDAELLEFKNGDFDDVDVDGIFTAGTKTFKIDHPVDPYNKLYYHGVVESPKFGLMYDGKIKLNNGEASLNLDNYYGQLPGTFEALVRKDTRRVFLQNNDTWDLVQGEVKDGVLTIVSNNLSSKAEIDWLITGERFDPFVVAGKMTDEDGNFILEVEKEDLDADDLAEIAKLDEPIEEIIEEVSDSAEIGEEIETKTLNFGNKKGWLRHPEERGKKPKKIKTKRIKKLKQ